MKNAFTEDLQALQKQYTKKNNKLKSLKDTLDKELNEYQSVEEQVSRLEKSISAQLIDIKSMEKHCNNYKQKISDRKRLNLPEKNQISDIRGFVEASKSVFTAKIFENLDHNSKTAEVLQGRSGEVLLEIAKISELVTGLKTHIADIKRAEFELEDAKKAEKSRKAKEIHQELLAYTDNTIKVQYKSWNNSIESCEFPMIDNLGNKITFSTLLQNACRYWNVLDVNSVIVDKDTLVWPGSSYVQDEVSGNDKEIWLMSREEANYTKVLTKKSSQKKDDEDEEEDLDSYRNLELTQAAEETFQEKKEKLEEKLEKESQKLEIVKVRNKNIINLLIYGLFIVLFTWTLQQFNSVQQMFWIRQGLTNLLFQTNFPVNSTSPLSYDSINLFQDFENFLTGPFVAYMFRDSNYNGEAFSESEQGFVGFSYKKIGPIRLIQKKVKIETCKQDFSEYLGRSKLQCFKDFSGADEFRGELNISGFAFGSWLRYEGVSSPRSVTGVLRKYDLEGYTAYLEPNLSNSEAQDMINLVVNEWIDLQTRFLSISSNLCNYNIYYCLSLEMVFEFIAGGGVLATRNLQLFRVNLNWSLTDKIRIALDVCSGCILLYFYIDLFLSVRKSGWKSTLLNFWNILLICLGIMMFSRYMAIVAYQNDYKIANFQDKSLEFIDYMPTALAYNVLTNFIGISSFLVYFYVLKFFGESKGLKIIWGTLAQGMTKLLFFFFVFILVFVGWMLLAYKGFGQYLQDYSSLGTTATTLLQMLLGNVNFQEIYQVQPEFSGLFFFLFIFLNYFLMLNVFLAIINESYGIIYSRMKSSDDSDEVVIILFIILNGIRYLVVTLPLKLITCKCCKRHQ